jgi:hypothetical protein
MWKLHRSGLSVENDHEFVIRVIRFQKMRCFREGSIFGFNNCNMTDFFVEEETKTQDNGWCSLYATINQSSKYLLTIVALLVYIKQVILQMSE